MDYEKKYNEILAWAKKYKARLNGVPIEDILPELRESEDERVVRKIESFLSAYGADYFGNDEWREIENWLEKQKEQKPAEKQNYSGLNDLERAIHRGFLCVGVENVPVTIIKETAQDCLAQMKPAWSEEDEDMLDSAIHIITRFDDLAHEPTFAGPKWTHPYTKELNFLEKLRNRLFEEKR